MSEAKEQKPKTEVTARPVAEKPEKRPRASNEPMCEVCESVGLHDQSARLYLVVWEDGGTSVYCRACVSANADGDLSGASFYPIRSRDAAEEFRGSEGGAKKPKHHKTEASKGVVPPPLKPLVKKK